MGAMSEWKREVQFHGLYENLFDGTEETEKAAVEQAIANVKVIGNAQNKLILKMVTCLSHQAAVARGWWHNIYTMESTPRNIGELYALFFTELGEAFEGYRTSAPSVKIPEFTEEEEELADLLVRIFDYATPRELRVWDAYFAKVEYNLRRPDHSLAARRAPKGKKI